MSELQKAIDAAISDGCEITFRRTHGGDVTLAEVSHWLRGNSVSHDDEDNTLRSGRAMTNEEWHDDRVASLSVTSAYEALIAERRRVDALIASRRSLAEGASDAKS